MACSYRTRHRIPLAFAKILFCFGSRHDNIKEHLFDPVRLIIALQICVDHLIYYSKFLAQPLLAYKAHQASADSLCHRLLEEDQCVVSVADLTECSRQSLSGECAVEAYYTEPFQTGLALKID